MSSESTIHQAVQQRYASLAEQLPIVQTQAAACCGESLEGAKCGCSAGNYDQALLEDLPIDVTGLSLGCGDPVTIAALRPGETVLDLGSGGGIDCFLAARQVSNTGFVIGVDMTPAMLARANANKVRMGVTNVEFREGHIESLPVEDNTIDAVMSNCVINLSPDKSAVFSEIFRVLKPGGRVSISDIVVEGAFAPEQRANLDSWSACLSGAVAAGDYITLLRQAGFENIAIVDQADASDIAPRRPDMPRLFSARITALKPAE